jgi:hypothetical protein
MSKKITLEDIFNDDEFGILDSKPKTSSIKSEDERLIESFQEINAFFEKYQREPNANNVTEFKLLARLKSLRADAKKKEILKSYDIHNLLNTEKAEIKSIDDILMDDDLGILDTDDTDEIFKLKNVPHFKDREETDFVARRKAIKNFEPYESSFKKVHKDLKEGKRKLIKYVGGRLQEKTYYILDGVMLYLENVDFHSEAKTLESGKRLRKDGRTKCIFENSTSSNMLYRSLEKGLYKNGLVITHSSDTDDEVLQKNVNAVNEDDQEAGWIYVLKSKSTNPQIAGISDLYKIGYSTIPVLERIKNASKEATYLKAEVHIISIFKCYNVNTQKFENLLHRFLALAKLNVDIFDENGVRITPREWFVVPIEVIEKAIDLLITGEIIEYKLDAVNNVIVEKDD